MRVGTGGVGVAARTSAALYASDLAGRTPDPLGFGRPPGFAQGLALLLVFAAPPVHAQTVAGALIEAYMRPVVLQVRDFPRPLAERTPPPCEGFRSAVAILGKVSDAFSEVPLAGATIEVVARDPETDRQTARRTTTSSPEGEFCIPGLLLPAIVEVRPTLDGFVGRGVVFEWDGGADVRVELVMRLAGQHVRSSG